jgi:hypothetical protein
VSATVSVMLCVNGDRGEPIGRVVGLDLTACGLELRDPHWSDRDAPVFRRLSDQAIRVGRRLFKVRGYRTWVGNWCWAAALMELPEANRLVVYLLDRGWMVEAGPVVAPKWLPALRARAVVAGRPRPENEE